MSHQKWSKRNELLNSLQTAIRQGTHGRLTRVCVDCLEGAIAVQACSKSYYGIQLAIGVVQEFTAEFPEATPSKMSFSINGHVIVLGGPQRNLGKEIATCANIRQGHATERLLHSSGRPF